MVNSSNSSPVGEFLHGGNVTSVGFQQDRSWLYSASEDGTIKIWDLRAPPRCQLTYTTMGDDGRQCACNALVLHPNQGELASADQAGFVRIWDLAADKCATQLRATEGQLKPIQSIAIASDASCLVAGTNEADIYVWCPSGPKRYELEHVIEAAHEDGSGHTYILKCCISPDAQLLVTTSSDKTAKIWSINRGWTLEKTLAQHQRWVWDACFSADSAYLVTASSDQSARLWDLQSGAAIRYYSGHSLAVTCCALNDSSA